MVRTRADNVKVCGAKLPRKAAILTPRSSGATRGRAAGGGGSGGFNHCRSQPVPSWQRPVAGFFQSAPRPSECAGDASNATGASTDPTIEREPRPGSSNSNPEPRPGSSNSNPEPRPGSSNSNPEPRQGSSNSNPEPLPGSSKSNPEPCESESPCRSSPPPVEADLTAGQPVSNGLISDDDD